MRAYTTHLQDPPATLLATAETVRVLDVSNNCFRVLHESLAALTSLERLTAAQNQIVAVECRFDALKRLRVRSTSLEMDPWAGCHLTTQHTISHFSILKHGTVTLLLHNFHVMQTGKKPSEFEVFFM
jgi:hypothetical protein